MLLRQTRLLVSHALPMLIAQLAGMAMMIVDTVLLGHFGTDDLAAVAVGGGIYVAVLFALAGIVQAVGPIVAQHYGARREAAIAPALRQAFWLALLLMLPGVALMLHPGALLSLSPIEPTVAAKVRAYLTILAIGMPAVLMHRAFYSFCNAVGQPRALMTISLFAGALHCFLAWLLVSGRWGGEGLGVVGCGIANAVAGWVAFLCALAYLRFASAMAPFRLFAHWEWPHWPALRELLRLGLPMGFSSFVEISAFTFIALFVAQLGAAVVAAHRIVANLAAVVYMLPLALAIATLAQVGQAVGARDARRARLSITAGLLLAGGLSTALGVILWLLATPLVEAYTSDVRVQVTALGLIGWLALYQVFDAVQTIAAFALRAYKITLTPMIVHVLCFWGVGLGGGWWLAFRGATPLGVAGFWIASLLSLVFAALLLGGLLWRAVVRARREAEQTLMADGTAVSPHP
ncbi:MATE family efflux transporter [Rhodocyclus tenuis]|uniref:Multidrug-efflux transporter n=1 Tax=Rhodocyclus gracilis TaxID=2929842 RepID=A0ABX0WK23_9RHOO|nr:MATE family efflux transporter [Rhodocyclus gracilis]